jgi:hypothetical protein
MWHLKKWHRTGRDNTVSKAIFALAARASLHLKARRSIKEERHTFQEGKPAMRSFISSFSLFQSILKPGTGPTHYLCKAFLLALALLVSSASAVDGQSLSNPEAAQGEPERGVSASAQSSDSKAAPVTDPATILRTAKLIYIRKKTAFIEPTELENELRKRPEFQRWGLAITRNETDADLIIEVSRKIFTRFVYTVIDPRTNIVVASGKLSSLGGTLSTKIAKRFIEQMQRVRQ